MRRPPRNLVVKHCSRQCLQAFLLFHIRYVDRTVRSTYHFVTQRPDCAHSRDCSSSFSALSGNGVGAYFQLTGTLLVFRAGIPNGAERNRICTSASSAATVSATLQASPVHRPGDGDPKRASLQFARRSGLVLPSLAALTWISDAVLMSLAASFHRWENTSIPGWMSWYLPPHYPASRSGDWVRYFSPITGGFPK
jgi:hypothetical protein